MTKQEIIDKLKCFTPECEILVYDKNSKIELPIFDIFYNMTEDGEGQAIIHT